MERRVNFEVFGREYYFLTNAAEEDVQEIMHMVKSQVEENFSTAKHIVPLNKPTVLLILNMAEQYVRLKREFKQYKQQVDSRVDRLVEKIEHSL